jgi:hypothetical protein
MQQRRKVPILASIRKKHKGGITLVGEEQEEKASDKSKKQKWHNTFFTIHRFVKKFLCID